MESAPVITVLTPAHGPLLGGTRVVVDGEGFADGCKIEIGGVETPASFLSSTQLAFVTPPRASSGSVDVRVVMPGVTSEPSSFDYDVSPAPSIVSVSPKQGPLAGGTELTIAGVHPASGCRVGGGGVGAPVSYDAPIQIRALTPPRMAPGPVDVKVVLPDGQMATASNAFEYARAPSPKIVRLEPKRGPAVGGTPIEVEGTDLAERVVLELDGVPLAVTRVSVSKLQAVTPPKKGGGVAWVRVLNPDGQFDVLAEGFVYDAPKPPPTVLSVSPGRSIVGQPPPRVIITGRDFDAGCKVQIGGVEAAVLAHAADKLEVTAPERGPVGEVDVRVSGEDGQSAVLARGFAYVLPAPPVGVAGFRPARGPVSGGTTVVITGANFAEGCFVEIGAGRARATFDGKSTLTFVTPAARTPGTVQLRVVRPDGELGVAAEPFLYDPVPPPKVVSMEPRMGSAAGGGKLTINGSGFAEGATVLVRGVEAKTRRLAEDTLEVTVPKTDEVGLADVEVRNPDRQRVLLENAIDYLRAR